MIDIQDKKAEVKQEVAQPQKDMESADDAATNASDTVKAEHKDAE